ncbi:ClpP/crotonase-like domain-containing protein [Bipolaris maydis]|nr:ClpP/crotonase-like domain-containing protein [Bipolaris maydis]
MAEAYQKEFFNVSFPVEYVAHVEINRPEKMNAFKEVMWLNLSSIFRQLSHDPNVRAVVLTGAGDRAFTAGLDVQAASNDGALAQKDDKTPLDGARKATEIRRHIQEFQDCITDIEKCEKPVIAVLHGISFGLALDLSLACDIRVSTNTTKFSVKEVDIGIAADIRYFIAPSHTPLATSPGSRTSASPRASSLQARHCSTGSCRPCTKTRQRRWLKQSSWQRRLRARVPWRRWGTKHLINYSRDRTVAEGLNYTAVWNAAMLQTDDVKDALLSGMQKRTPKFSKL